MTDIVTVMRAVCDAVIANRDHLCDLDAALGDGDHGVSMAKTFTAVQEQLDGLEGEPASVVLEKTGMIILTSVGGAMGPLFGSAFRAASTKLTTPPVGPTDIADAVAAARDSIAEVGGAKPGDKTMLDAFDAAATAAEAAAGSGADEAGVVEAAAQGAEQGAAATVDMRASVGRASRLGDRTIGHADPGATSVAIMLRAAADAMSATAGSAAGR